MNNTDQATLLAEARLPSWGRINPSRLQAIKEYAGQKVLDVGCSTGAYIQYLNSRNHYAFGVDLIRDQEWLPIQPQTNLVGSATELPYQSNSFDTVLAFEILEHLTNYERAVDEMNRVSRRNIIVSVPDCTMPEAILGGGLVYSHWRDRTHCNFFTFESLANLLTKHGFSLDMIKGINPVRPEYLFLRSYYFPQSLAKILTALLRRIPLRRPYNMTILAVATKRD